MRAGREPIAAGLAALVAMVVLLASLVGVAALRPDTADRHANAGACGPGQAARGSAPGDALCVASLSRDRVAIENRLAASRRAVDGDGDASAAGCRDGFVPREAVPGDAVCVTPRARAWVQAENGAEAVAVGSSGAP